MCDLLIKRKLNDHLSNGEHRTYIGANLSGEIFFAFTCFICVFLAVNYWSRRTSKRTNHFLWGKKTEHCKIILCRGSDSDLLLSSIKNKAVKLMKTAR